MSKLRVALAGVSPLVGDIIEDALRGSAHLHVVGRLEPSADLLDDLARSGAEVLICARSNEEMESVWNAALTRLPSLVVLNMLDDHRTGRLYALRQHRTNIDDVSVDSLSEVLRAQMWPEGRQ